ncbi:hypothetical protein GT204_27795 [Streptomyces sp. SID4919]|uniref:hypothetical protein n=1 Tax=unclassified Streptomyces TaxID=2593676 RepID=UPI000823E990|nr:MULTISPECIES: hypothetical protein [unclassified Streptomyces]MYY12597.1 hypothetical protein [Streptomyces sp. SID4919]SCK19546.1 hypothetical protein YW7DRAFT_01391 [Streptomyces sp. AmelKG-E11A]
MICCRCDGPIEVGDPYEVLLRHSVSRPATRTHRHTHCPDEATRADRDHAALEDARYAAWGRLMTHLGACPQCPDDDLWACPTGRRLRKEWRTAERDAR